MRIAYNPKTHQTISPGIGLIGQCLECKEEVTPVLPTQDIEDHWRHRPGSNCAALAMSHAESDFHLGVKAYFRAQGFDTEVKWGNRRADVHFDGRTVEVQWSAISPTEVSERAADYGVNNLVWVVPRDSPPSGVTRQAKWWTDEHDLESVAAWLRTGAVFRDPPPRPAFSASAPQSRPADPPPRPAKPRGPIVPLTTTHGCAGDVCQVCHPEVRDQWKNRQLPEDLVKRYPDLAGVAE